MNRRCLWVGLLSAAALAAWALDLQWESTVLAAAHRDYGIAGQTRVRQWFDFMRAAGGLSEQAKLQAVNQFFNHLPNVSDEERWGSRDHWATPLELLGGNGGDCEDFVIAKYFSLRELGVADDKLQFAYVKAFLRASGELQSHMVLAYYATPGDEPYLLDSLSPSISVASKRTDLIPTYSFPANRLWAARQRKLAGRVDGDQADMVRDLMRQMAGRRE